MGHRRFVNSQMGALLVGNHFLKCLPIPHNRQVYVSFSMHLEAVFHKTLPEAVNFADRKGPRNAVRHFGDSGWGTALNANSCPAIVSAVQQLTLP